MAALRSLALALLAFLFSPAHAAFVYPPPPPGWGGSASTGWTFGGTSSANATWAAGRAPTLVPLNIGGRQVFMPAEMRLAAQASQVVARAALLTPLGRLTSFITWAQLAGWLWDEAESRWEVEEGGSSIPNEGQYLWAYSGYVATLSVTFSSVSGAAGYAIQWRRDNGLCNGTCVEEYTGPGTCAVIPVGASSVNCDVAARRSNNSGSTWETISLGVRGTPNPNPIVPGRRAVTADDADDLAELHPIPDAVVNDAQRYVPLPQQLPEATPRRYPVGFPWAVPGTSPQQYDQPFVDARLRPTAELPWRTDLIPTVVRGTDPTGQTSDQPITGSSPPGDAASGAASQTDCDKYPEAAGCKPLGIIGPVAVTEVGRPMAITPDAGWGEGGGYACPSDKVVDLSFGQITFPFALFCQAADMARPFVIAMGWLTAVIGFFGLGRRD